MSFVHNEVVSVDATASPINSTRKRRCDKEALSADHAKIN